MSQLQADYYIDIEEIHPMGDIHFAAKAIFSKEAHTRRWPIPLPEKEYLARTEEEAKHKVREAVKEWAKQCNAITTELL